MVRLGRRPEELYQNEMDLLVSLAHLLRDDKDEYNTWDFEYMWAQLKEAKCGILPYLKKSSTCNYKIKTVKIAFILDNGVHMHKDIDFEGI